MKGTLRKEQKRTQRTSNKTEKEQRRMEELKEKKEEEDAVAAFPPLLSHSVSLGSRWGLLLFLPSPSKPDLDSHNAIFPSPRCL